MEHAVEITNLSKCFKVYKKQRYRLLELVTGQTMHEEYQALKHVNLSVKKGESLGIVGANGAGKSTLLKLICGALYPTCGSVDVHGRVLSLLELGTGFHPELTGIENIYNSASMQGFAKKEVEEKISDMIEFADIGEYIHRPVKTYSSGMLVRLAFALAINVEPEILIIDEALAVGDAFFQAKCFHKLEDIKNNGTTILFVSHDIISVKKMCSRVLWLDNGIMREIGEANAVCEKYMSAQIERTNKENEKILSQLDLKEENKDIREEKEKVSFPRLVSETAEAVSGTGKVNILSFYIKDNEGNETKLIKTEKEYKFGVVAEFKESLEHVIFGFELENLRGVRVFGINNFMQQKAIPRMEAGKICEVSFTLVLPKICKGEYLVTPAVSSGTQSSHVVQHRVHNCETIYVENDGYNIALIELDAETNIIKHDKADVLIR